MSSPDGDPRHGPTLPVNYNEVFLSQVSVVTLAPPPRRNSPFVLVAVLSIVLVGVLSIAVVGKVTSGGTRTTIEGHALAVGEQALADTPKADKGTLADVAANKLLTPGAPLPQVDCALPELGTEAGELDAYYRMGIACLDQAWRPALTAAGLPFRSPGLNIDDAPRSKCGFAPGEDEATAFYCARDKIIYMPRKRLIRDAGDETAYHLAVLAHEYGHHVQALAGILGAVNERERQADEDETLELSRRTELQANCFAGMFLAAVGGRGSVDADLAEESAESFEDTQGTDTHGTRENQLVWAMAGYDGKSSASCNTFAAPSPKVE
ncbi:YpfJ protein, zinc metalloprotease superfamily [Alloactinosynnema sp. L-07]|uniref:neutral zinc metallopeptidase n=1 Tax=Alloactinosynnema sp. L-07 TaxID=1653480 RepID=UPI00065F0A6F|nr:neutral zinc metallopeptidase [Alloactinosynnema sp. L-07]CRK55777.1 YpfJ protein, zinc metalloprotease superfamily [Alloactinosynnema sp. L-07]